MVCFLLLRQYAGALLQSVTSFYMIWVSQKVVFLASSSKSASCEQSIQFISCSWVFLTHSTFWFKKSKSFETSFYACFVLLGQVKLMNYHSCGLWQSVISITLILPSTDKSVRQVELDFFISFRLIGHHQILLPIREWAQKFRRVLFELLGAF